MRYLVLKSFTAAGVQVPTGAVVSDPPWCNAPSLEAQGFIEVVGDAPAEAGEGKEEEE